jgi:heme-degrading monooxygenase HmoA
MTLFCVLYRFVVHAGLEERFVSSWRELTRHIHEHCGSLGSRLHKAGEREYVAYAQWPSREAWERAELPEGAGRECRAEMRACCETVETQATLDVVEDQLRSGR